MKTVLKMTRRSINFLVILLLLSQPIFSWNMPGHMTVGAIAYYELLESNPKALDKLISILKNHPYYKPYWKKQFKYLPTEENLIVFIYAARWADEKGLTEIEKLWHYKDYPFVLDEGNKTVESINPPVENIENAFNNHLKVMNSSGNSDEEKAVALAWILHIVGDAHQPLHSISLFSTRFPNGDEGGNFLRVDFPWGNKVKLHAFWDNAVFDMSNKDLQNNNFQPIIKRVQSLRKKYPRSGFSDFFTKTSIENWTKESYQLASLVYPDIILNNSIRKKALKEADFNSKMADYEKESVKIAEKRFVLSGYRLTNLCQMLAEQAP